MRLVSRVAERLKSQDLRKSGNIRKMSNLTNVAELQPSVQLSSQNENEKKKLLKKRKQTFPLVLYFTWKLEFVSNILFMIVFQLASQLAIFRKDYLWYFPNASGYDSACKWEVSFTQESRTIKPLKYEKRCCK